MYSEMFPTVIRNTATRSAFNIGRGVSPPIIITIVASSYNLGFGILIAAIFALLTEVWIWIFPETKCRKLLELEKNMENPSYK